MKLQEHVHTTDEKAKENTDHCNVSHNMIMVHNLSQVQNQVLFTPVHKSIYKGIVMHIVILF